MEQYQLTRLDSMTMATYQAQYKGNGGSAFTGGFVYYNQADAPWGDLRYVAGDPIRKSGCAATSLAMVWATYGKDASITPQTVFSIGNKNGALSNGCCPVVAASQLPTTIQNLAALPLIA